MRLLMLAVLLGQLAGASAAEWDVGGSIGVELRGFPDAPAYPGQLNGVEHSLVIEPDIRLRAADGRILLRFEPRWRVETQDGERDNFDLGQASATFILDDWDLLAGVDKVFWGVTESRHLVDIINQTDLVEDIDQEDKLGQAMISAETQRDWGRLSFFVLPGFEERTFPGSEGRLRTPLPVDTDDPVYESSDADDHVDFAVRYSHYVGDWDIGAHVFEGTSREPVLRPNATGTMLQPYYAQITQVGVDVQYTREAWLWKLETIRRAGHGERFSAAVGGFEYTFYQVGGGSGDVGILAEYLYDGRGVDAPVTPFNRDLFLGARWAFNDVQDTSVLAGVIVDTHDGSRLVSIEAERRFGDHWKLEVESRWFVDVAAGNDLNAFREDSYLTARFTRHF